MRTPIIYGRGYPGQTWGARSLGSWAHQRTQHVGAASSMKSLLTERLISTDLAA